jgi:hypothetical protein
VKASRLALTLAVLSCAAASQDASSPAFSQRGFFETRNYLYPLEAEGDSGRIVSEQLLRWESQWKARPALRFHLTLDSRFDSHRQFERALRLDWFDRSIQRPALSVRRLSAAYHRGGLTLEAGRQFIRWGKADLLNPTDRFAPKDFLNVVNTEFLGVWAARATYERGGHTFDAVWQPYFTPSRSPLLKQRWVVLPPQLEGVPLEDAGFRFPGRGQWGARYSRVAPGYEFSLSLFDGFNHLPLLEGGVRTIPDFAVTLQRYFARILMTGGDLAVPLPWFTLKAEAAYFASSTPQADEYAQYVVQAERLAGEWTFVGGYAGEAITTQRSQLDFAPDRGLTKTFLGRASYNLDANRTVSLESAVRQNLHGLYSKLEYTQTLGDHWRLTLAGALLAGRDSDFLGQYKRNSHFAVALRYSF